MKKTNVLACTVLTLLSLAPTGKAQVVSVQFQGYGTALTSTQPAGYIPADYFNVETGETGSDLALEKSGGGTTTDLLSYATTDEYNTLAFTATANDTLLSGKIGPLSVTGSVTISGLASGTYDLLVYTVNDTANRTGTFSLVGGPSYSITDDTGTNFASDGGTFYTSTNTVVADAGAPTSLATYIRFSDIKVTAGTIEFTSTPISGAGGGAGAFNGFQLVKDVPEPSETVLLLGGVGVLAVALRLRKRA